MLREGRKVTLDITFGTMIELPRAALVAEGIAQDAEFFSFGTNDLTQMTMGSPATTREVPPAYVETGILPEDPFVSLDQRASASSSRWRSTAAPQRAPS